MEERMESLFRNRYAYRRETTFEWELKQGVSQKKLAKYWEGGILTEQMLCLMEGMVELSIMSAKQIESFFWLKWMPECYSKVRTVDGKNAYRGLIRQMNEYGILVPGIMKCEGKVVGSRVYGLSSGALQFFKEYHGSRQACLSDKLDGLGNTDARLGSNLEYSTLLSVLSLNQLHLHVLGSYGRRFQSYGRIWINGSLPANLYCTEGENIVVWSLRGGPSVYTRFREHVKSVEEFQYKAIHLPHQARHVVVVEHMEWPMELQQYLSDVYAPNLVYTTDQEVFEGNAMKRYIEVTGANSYRFIG